MSISSQEHSGFQADISAAIASLYEPSLSDRDEIYAKIILRENAFIKPGNSLESRLEKTNLSKILFLAYFLLLIEHRLINSFVLLPVEKCMNR